LRSDVLYLDTCRDAGKVGQLPTRATSTEQVRERLFVNLGCPGSFYPRVDIRPPGHDLRFGVGIHETTFRVNVRWVTPLGEETASTS
jgi:hypothetical protein